LCCNRRPCALRKKCLGGSDLDCLQQRSHNLGCLQQRSSGHGWLVPSAHGPKSYETQCGTTTPFAPPCPASKLTAASSRRRSSHRRSGRRMHGRGCMESNPDHVALLDAVPESEPLLARRKEPPTSGASRLGPRSELGLASRFARHRRHTSFKIPDRALVAETQVLGMVKPALTLLPNRSRKPL